MSAVASHDHAAEHGHEPPYAVRLRNNRLGLWLFCFSELFLFAGLIAGRFYLWGGSRPELNQVIALIATTVLLASSFAMNRAETAIAYDDRKPFLRWLVITFVMGLGFLVGVVLFEWGLIPLEEHVLRPTDGAFGAIFFLMTGLHALHVVTGLILIAIVYYNGRRGGFSAEEHWGVEACAIYWHYVDVIWIFFYPLLYLVGTAVPLA